MLVFQNFSEYGPLLVNQVTMSEGEIVNAIQTVQLELFVVPLLLFLLQDAIRDIKGFTLEVLVDGETL